MATILSNSLITLFANGRHPEECRGSEETCVDIEVLHLVAVDASLSSSKPEDSVSDGLYSSSESDLSGNLLLSTAYTILSTPNGGFQYHRKC